MQQHFLDREWTINMDGCRLERRELEAFCTRVFEAMGAVGAEASDAAEILVAADAAGIESHGVARLRRYVNGIKAGIMVPNVEGTVVHSTPLSLVIDGNGAMGLHLSKKTMADVIQRAESHGAAFASVRDSNHFGIAGYYAKMALPKDMIGIAMTNTAALGVPTFAKDAYFGTNPLAVAVPAHREAPFVLDMSTTVVTRGKIETYLREGRLLPEQWAVDKRGIPTQDSEKLLADMLYQLGGGILPLGGSGELTSGYKGYGLAVMVDIFTAVLSGGLFGRDVVDAEGTSGRVAHFFGAVRLDLFRDPEAIKEDMGAMLEALRTAEPAVGESQVYYAGLKEHLHEQACAEQGIPLSGPVWRSLQAIGEELNLPLPQPKV